MSGAIKGAFAHDGKLFLRRESASTRCRTTGMNRRMDMGTVLGCE